MKEQIQQAARRLRSTYYLFWLLPALLFAAGETELIPVGAWVDATYARFSIETLTILFTALCVPLALKLFSRVMKQRIQQLTIDRALAAYVKWSIIRLALLEAVVLLALACYYLTLSQTGGLCALIGLTASFFCLPSEKRLREELFIEEEKTGEEQ